MIDPLPPAPSPLRQRLRRGRDRLATALITAGGVGVILAVLAIGIFLVLEVVPLFGRAEVRTLATDARPRLEASSDVEAWEGRLAERLEAPLTAMAVFPGERALIAADAAGGLRRWLVTPEGSGLLPADDYRLPGDEAVVWLHALPEQRLFLAGDAAGRMALYQAQAGRLWRGEAPSGTPVGVNEAGELLWQLEGGQGEEGMLALRIEAEHAEVSWRTLWQPRLYEGYDEPQQRWRPNVISAEQEPHYGLMPMVWGTLKAAGWALLFAVPLALGAAMHSAVFMSQRLRSRLKPTLELMEALPGVVIGFVAGLVLAPYVERHLAGAMSLLLVLPLGLVLIGMFWARLPAALRRRLPPSWAGLWLVPCLAALVALAMLGSPWLEAALFGGDLRGWLETRWGLDYATRNAVIVGLAMAFAVIPGIYALAEDALTGVPPSLAEGAQALGATPWQTLWKVLLPAAGPGIFTAVMIGAGRAVGETMIVLMASGNTGLMSLNPLEGMRSLAASIAIELPEAAPGGTHYRVLFLAALSLFVFTFLVNTLAEVVRDRLRRRYRRLGSPL